MPTGFGDEILLVASAVHGVKVPDSTSFAAIVSKEIENIFSSGCLQEIGYEEILFAIRLNGNTHIRLPETIDVDRVKFFGSFISPSFISAIMSNYMAIRDFLDKKLQYFIDNPA